MKLRKFVSPVAAGAMVLLSVVSLSGGAYGQTKAVNSAGNQRVDARNSSSSTLTVAESTSPTTLDPYASPLRTRPHRPCRTSA